jgi:hypothetical protein
MWGLLVLLPAIWGRGGGLPVPARGLAVVSNRLLFLVSGFRAGVGLVHTTTVVVSGGFMMHCSRTFQGQRLMAMSLEADPFSLLVRPL